MRPRTTKNNRVYGKRNQRKTPPGQPQAKQSSPFISPDNLIQITQIPNDSISQRKQENCTPPKQSPKTFHIQKKRPLYQTPQSSPSRTPLSPFSINRKPSPGKPRKYGASKLGKGSLLQLKPSSPVVKVDIFVLDGDGKKVSQEQRSSNPKTKVQEIHQELSSGDESDSPQPIRRRRLVAKAKPIILSSDEDSPAPRPKRVMKAKPSAVPPKPSIPIHIQKSTKPLKIPIHHATKSVPSKAPVVDVATPYIHKTPPLPQTVPTHPRRELAISPTPRTRQLTPFRASSRSHHRPCSPSQSSDSDFDISAIDLSDISIEIPVMGESTHPTLPTYPDFLGPLLEECRQEKTGPCEFSSFIQTFQYDPVLRPSLGMRDVKLRKIGEASYSEVFGIGDIVLKIVPLRNEISPTPQPVDDDLDVPFESDAKDVLKEILVTRAMSNVCDHFVKLFKTYVVKGRYPQVLLELWDHFNTEKGSESVRPDTFSTAQHYAVIALPNGGLDLEAYNFARSSRLGWRQACSIFWQVAKTLAHGERLVSFEHRDLHWGQVLVTNTSNLVIPLGIQDKNAQLRAKSESNYMDNPSHGVKATLIDFGLSRMDAGDGCGGEQVHWTAFDPEILLGEGDYQFDIYRYMKAWNGGDWEPFRPFTNVMWLHYLVQKLLHHKGLKPPSPPRKHQHSPATKGFSERACFESLVDIEKWLQNCLSNVIPAKNVKAKGRKTQRVTAISPSPACAGEIVAYAEKRGWVKAF